MDLDLNADLGEGAGTDAELMTLVTSANVCCGAHAGGPTASREAVELAARHGVTVGAHPGYADRAHFGRRELALSRAEVFDLGVSQINTLLAFHHPVRYIKPHGALYHQACRDGDVARGVVDAARVWGLPLVGLPGSRLEAAALAADLRYIAEGFADRRYRPDGTLVPRSEPDALLHDPAEAVAQIGRLVRDHGVRTVCVHGDSPGAVAFTRAVRDGLVAKGFMLKAFA